MRKKILIFSVIIAGLAAIYGWRAFSRNQTSADILPDDTSVLQTTSNEPEIKSELPKEPETEVLSFRDKINMHKWLRHKKHHIYYQLGIPYCSDPTAPELQKLAIFVPSKFMKCQKNVSDDTYTCEPNPESRINVISAKEAPVVMPIDAPDYADIQPLSEYKDVREFTQNGFIYVQAGCRGIEAAAPACVADLKAAIRFLRHNKNNIPTDAEYFFVFGQGHGGGLAAVLGASGDSQLYQPYLQEIGAINAGSDAVYGVMAWSPITGLESANEAYEWNMGYTRKGITQNQHEFSNRLARAYADYVNNSGFRDERNNSLMLQYSERGIYQTGTYYDYIQEVIEEAATEFFETTDFPYTPQRRQYQFGQFSSGETPVIGELDPQGTFLTRRQYMKYINSKRKWFKYDYTFNSVVIRSVDDFIQSFKPATREIASFDAINRQQLENRLFRTDDGQNRHFDELTMKILQTHPKAKEFAEDLIATDRLGITVAQRRNMYSPLYYLLPSSQGYRSAQVAPIWRIRSDINQTAIALMAEINLSLAARRYPEVKKVDFTEVWAAEDVMAETLDKKPTDAFIEWIMRLYR